MALHDVDCHACWRLPMQGPLQHAMPQVDDGELARIARRNMLSLHVCGSVSPGEDMSGTAR